MVAAYWALPTCGDNSHPRRNLCTVSSAVRKTVSSKCLKSMTQIAQGIRSSFPERKPTALCNVAKSPRIETSREYWFCRRCNSILYKIATSLLTYTIFSQRIQFDTGLYEALYQWEGCLITRCINKADCRFITKSMLVVFTAPFKSNYVTRSASSKRILCVVRQYLVVRENLSMLLRKLLCETVEVVSRLHSLLEECRGLNLLEQSPSLHSGRRQCNSFSVTEMVIN